ncbi:MAG: FecR family protein [Spirochaetota bacterium]
MEHIRASLFVLLTTKVVTNTMTNRILPNRTANRPRRSPLSLGDGFSRRVGGRVSLGDGLSRRVGGRALILVVLLLAAATAPAVGQEFGRIAYLEGSVTMYQQGEERFADIGAEVYPGDLLRTGGDGYLELEIKPGPTTVKVAEDTALYVERRDSHGRRETGFRLLRGNLDFVVKRLAGDEAVSVDAQSASMGVRGTEFAVRTSPDDSVAVGVSDGSVEVTGEGATVRADSGVVVESIQQGELSSQEVGSDEIDEYLEGWRETRLQAFRSGAETFVTAYARRYLDQRPRFIAAYRALSTYADRLSSAVEDDERRDRGGRFQLRAEVSGAAVQVRSILPVFENTFYRLAELGQFHEEGVGRTQIDEGLNSEQFFSRYDTEKGRIEAQLAQARYLLTLYRKIEEESMGGLPSGESLFDSDSMRPNF